jgi:hypothetical protein
VHQLVDAVAEGHRGHDPHDGDEGRREPHRHHLLGRGLETHLEEEEDRPELGEDEERLARLEGGQAGAAEEREVAEEDAEEQLPEDGGLAQALDHGAEELGPHEDEGEGEQDAALFGVAGGGGEDEGDRGHRVPSLPAVRGP